LASAISFQGLSSGLQTDQLVNAILQQESRPLQRLQSRVDINNQRTQALQGIVSNLRSLGTSLSTLQYSSFSSRTVTSSDSNGTYVTATAAGASAGSYDVKVDRIATKATLGGSAFAVADPLTTKVFNDGTATSADFAVQGTDGTIKTFSLASTNNSIYGLRDAVNASGAGVTATVVNTGIGANPYQLILTAKDTGTGTTSGKITLAETTSGGPLNSLGIAAGTVDSPTTPTTLTGGTASAGAQISQDAQFVVNGTTLNRKSNVVTDAVDGVTFTLKQGGQTTATTFGVTLDTGTITSQLQDVVSKFNAVVTAVSTGSKSGGALATDPTIKNLLSQVRAALGGVPAGLSASNPYQTGADVGLKTNRDGTLSLDTTILKAALDANPDAVKKVFALSASSNNAAVSFVGASSVTATGALAFNITSYTSGSGDVSGTVNGVAVTGTGGVLYGPAGSSIEGLTLSVSGTGSGTLTLSRGIGQAVQDLVAKLTASGSGQLSQTISSLSTQNLSLQKQIATGQQRLDRRKEVLQQEFANLEATLGQLQGAGQSLAGLR
jgi:flagellar hook-associated protein 2